MNKPWFGCMSDEADSTSSGTGPVTRRSVLQTAAGAATAGTGLAAASEGTGLASAAPGEGPGGSGHRKYNVGFAAEAGRAATHEAASEVVREFAFDALTVRLPEQAVAGLRKRPDVRYVEVDGTGELLSQDLPWGVDRVDADLAPSQVDGTGVDVAILDSGIDSDHPDLQANLGGGAWVNVVECTGCSVGWGDDVGHGTVVAGIVGAIDNSIDVVGVAPAVTLHAMRVCDTDGCTDSHVAAGLEWVADEGHDVANMSFHTDQASVLEDAIDYAADQDVLMVAAAGNDGPCSDCVNYPARDDLVVGVSATDDTDDLADFSSQGPEVDLAAPGVSVETTALGGGTTSFDGTSAAAPHVTGVAALARMLVPGRQDATDLLLDKAEDLGLSFEKEGRGLVDAEAVADEPWVLTDFASVDSFVATMHGELRLAGFASSVDVYFEWGVSGEGFPKSTDPQTLSTPGSFSETVSGLTCSTTYEYRAVAEASDGDTATGTVRFFSPPECQDDGDDCGQKIIC